MKKNKIVVESVAKYGPSMSLGQIMDISGMKEIVLRHIPDVESDPRYPMGRGYSLGKIKYEVGGALREAVEKIIEDLLALE